MGKDTGSIEDVPGICSGCLWGRHVVCVKQSKNMFNMRNRKIYVGKPQIIDEQQLFHNNNLTFNTLTSKF